MGSSFPRLATVAFALAAFGPIAGCQTGRMEASHAVATDAYADPLPSRGASPALIFLPETTPDLEANAAPVPLELGFVQALASRNDDRLGGLPAQAAGFEAVQIRHREHLRTINGRPREFSTTSTHTLERRIRP